MTSAIIRSPRWSQPAFAAPGAPLCVALDAPRRPDARLFLECGLHRAPLEVSRIERLTQARIVLYHAVAPDSFPDGLADLVLVEGARRHVEPRAVAVRRSEPEHVRIAHVSDWHLLKLLKDGTHADRTDLLIRLVQRLNALAPDCIIHTGDVITRYYAGGAPLPDERIRWQVRRAREVFDLLQAPVFVLPGNHDLAYEVCREAWWEAFGRPWRRETDDTALTLGPCRLVLLDGFARYDRRTLKCTAQSLTHDQIAWLQGALDRSEARWRIVALHYDYSNQILPRLDELAIDLLLYGHSKSKEPRWFEGARARNGHFPLDCAYRLINASAQGLQIEPPVSWGALEVTAGSSDSDL